MSHTNTVYQNPVYYKGPVLQRVSMLAKDSQTWQAGQFARSTDSGIVLCVSSATSVQYLTAENQPTATSTSTVPLWKIPSAETQFVMGVTSKGVDTLAPASLIGSNEGLSVNSCICTVSVNNDTNEIFHIEDIYSNKEKYSGGPGSDTSDDPGFVIVSVVASALTTEGAGL